MDLRKLLAAIANAQRGINLVQGSLPIILGFFMDESRKAGMTNEEISMAIDQFNLNIQAMAAEDIARNNQESGE